MKQTRKPTPLPSQTRREALDEARARIVEGHDTTTAELGTAAYHFGDCARGIRSARTLIDAPGTHADSLRPTLRQRNRARQASVHVLARAVGWRLQRVLPAVERALGLRGPEFRRACDEFSATFDMLADDAHDANERDERPDLAAAVVELVQAEILRVVAVVESIPDLGTAGAIRRYLAMEQRTGDNVVHLAQPVRAERSAAV